MIQLFSVTHVLDQRQLAQVVSEEEYYKEAFAKHPVTQALRIFLEFVQLAKLHVQPAQDLQPLVSHVLEVLERFTCLIASALILALQDMSPAQTN